MVALARAVRVRRAVVAQPGPLPLVPWYPPLSPLHGMHWVIRRVQRGSTCFIVHPPPRVQIGPAVGGIMLAWSLESGLAFPLDQNMAFILSAAMYLAPFALSFALGSEFNTR